MKVLFLVPRLDKASTRYRVLQYFPALDESGIDHEVVPLSLQARRRVGLHRQIRSADVVFVQKKLFSLPELLWVRLAARRLIYDFDDAVMFKNKPTGPFQQARQMKRFENTVRRADLVLAGNRYLQEQARTYNRDIRVLPTVLDMDRYVERPDGFKTDQSVTLGWIGSKGTLQYLREIGPALEVLGLRWPGLKLKIVADDFIDLQHLEVIKKPWRVDEEIADLHSFDIGLMPLADDVWTRGKCGFKLLQCMAVGLPVVCSPVGVNVEMVSSGQEGFLATSHQEWVAGLDALIADAGLRRTMGRQAREAVLKGYSLAAKAPLFISYLKGAGGPEKNEDCPG